MLSIDMYGRSNPGGALVPLDVSLSVTITELSKAMVCGALPMGHCRVVIPVAGFSHHLIDSIIKD